MPLPFPKAGFLLPGQQAVLAPVVPASGRDERGVGQEGLDLAHELATIGRQLDTSLGRILGGCCCAPDLQV